MGVESVAVRMNCDARIGGVIESMDAGYGSEERFESILQELVSLNRQYLDLLTGCGGLSACAMGHLHALPSSALDAMARCPFSLFAFELDWAVQLGSQRRDAVKRDPIRSECAAAAGFLAWHAVRVDSTAARSLFGIDTQRVDFLRSISLGRLQSAVDSLADSLRPRWPNCELFWLPLMQGARDGVASVLRSAHLYGRQLLAAEVLAKNPSLAAQSGKLVARRVSAGPRHGAGAALMCPLS